MTSKERVLAAVNHRESDRVPITFDAEMEVYINLFKSLGINTREELFDFLNVDTWMILPENFIYPKDQENLMTKTSIWGFRTKNTFYSGGSYDELSWSPLAGENDIDDIKKFPWPSDDALGFSGFPAEIDLYKQRAIIGVFTWGAYFIATHVRGIENLMLDFALNKKYAHYLIDTIADRSLFFLEKMLNEYGDGIDIVYMADDYCSQIGPFFSPDNFTEFVVPYLSKLVETVHKHDKKFLLHVCGAVRPLLPMIIDAGVDMLEPIQTRAQGMGPEGLKQDFGKDICFYGGMDLQHILCHGTEQQVAEEARFLIDVLGKDGGYIFGPGHTYIQVDAPLENILTMYKTAYSYRPHSVNK